MKRIHVTLRDYTYNTYIKDYKANVSDYIESIFLHGIDSIESQESTNKGKFIEILKENAEMKEKLRNSEKKEEKSKEKIKNLYTEIELLKTKHKEYQQRSNDEDDDEEDFDDINTHFKNLKPLAPRRTE